MPEIVGASEVTVDLISAVRNSPSMESNQTGRAGASRRDPVGIGTSPEASDVLREGRRLPEQRERFEAAKLGAPKKAAGRGC